MNTKKLIFITFFILSGFANLYSQDSAVKKTDSQTGCISGDCQNGTGTFIDSSSARYVGEFKDGKYNGQGTYFFSDGRKYVGEFKDGERSGQGTLTHPNGDYCVAEFKHNKRNGFGSYYFANGDKYVGEFKDGYPNGQGTHYYINGEIKAGEWNNGNYVSNGATGSSENSNTGCISGDCQNGTGTFIYSDGQKYIGEFKKGKRDGQGTIYFTGEYMGDKYIGEFRDNKRYGQGTYYYANGDRYTGEWKDAKPNGEGTYYSANGDEKAGEWKDGNYIGQGSSGANQPKISIKNKNGIVHIGSTTTVINDYSHRQETTGTSQPVSSFSSDVDKDIPVNKHTDENTFALIIGNEDYKTYQPDITDEMNVQFAVNDATVFKDYCIKTFGVPEDNITFLKNATLAKILQAINKLNKLIQATHGKANVIVYYAGHGLPNDTTREPYLIPVDVSGSDISSAIKLSYLYDKLTEYPSQKVTVFLDACFSGGGRESGLLAARGVKITPKESALKGNIVVFAASSAEESSLPLKAQQHGMFTYYLLKEFQQTKGDISFSDLSSFLKDKVEIESLKINDKDQHPQVLFSNDDKDSWGDWKLK